MRACVEFIFSAVQFASCTSCNARTGLPRQLLPKTNNQTRIANMTTLTLADSFTALLISMKEKCRCAELLLKAQSNPRYLSPDKPGNFIAYRESSGLVSYCPAGRAQQLTQDGKWERRGRQDARPGKWARATLNARLASRIKPEA